ncbi:AsmA family protein [Dichotomicrobium thermohalophilum]|uniref:AsmA-like protein n=1 Tax=Dichotomicrobium thermohalophilum TaxID=933063 RepID=A0A397Q7U8_9HYPH|nr:AsmA family protein [Dichotomicrobium thermohalophilum]RIA55577.1 AsmA-like protein [Dichotomicrobium thermohalophilum]
MNVLLAALTSLLIVVFAAAFAAPYVVDWNEYRPVFEAQASKLAGRPVRVEGNVDLTILPVPEVRFEAVSIADRDGSFDSPSATARAFRMALSIPPLLRGQIEARKIELDRLSLRLGLDENGQVEWPRIGEAAGGLPFMPADISLKSVTLNEASLAVARPGEPARWRVDGVSGELSAETLGGPFKFAGQAVIGDHVRDLQLSVGSMTAEGLMPVKAVSRGEVVVYRVEGNLRDLTDGPEFLGDVEASAPQTPEAGAQAPQWRAEATGRATLDGANFDDFSVTITRKQRTQTLNGTARLTWGQGLRLDAELRSQWLDLDLLAGAQVQDRMPAEVLLQLPDLLADVPVPARRARIDLRIAQVSLGGDLIRDVHAVARRGDGGWGVETLQAGLPGGSSLGFEGQFARKDGAPMLAGKVRASGSNLGRLLQWAAPEMFEERDAAAKSFSLSGEVESAVDAFNISEISARLGKSRLSGDVRLAFDQASATLDLDARTLDLRPYIRGETAEMVGKLLGRENGLTALQAKRWQVAVRANRLILPEFAASDVQTRLRIDPEGIVVETVSLHGADGLRLTGSGRYPLGKTQAAPELRLSLAANNAARVEEVARAVPGAAEWLAPHVARLRAAAPLHVTASLRPSEVENGYWLRIDGRAAQTELLANARIYEGERYHLVINAENRTLRGLARQIAPDLTDWLTIEEATGPARLRADFAGAAGEPWTGTAALETSEVRLAYDGSAEPATLRLDGEATVEATSAEQAFALAGLPAAGSGALALRASVSSEGSVFRARDLRVDLAEHTTTGNARLDVSGAVPEVEVNLNAGRFNLARAGALILERREQGAQAFWPDAPFAIDTLSRVSGNLSLAADELAVAEGLILRDATLMARLEDGALRVPMVSGILYGGEAVASAELRPARGRTVFDGEIVITELDLAQLPHGQGAPLATGRAEVSLRAESEGLSPRGLMTVMSGTGRIELGAGEIRGLDPQVLARTARAYLAAEDQPEETVAAQLAQPLRESRLAHDGAQTALRLKDGALRLLDTQVFSDPEGLAVEARARVDLTEMELTSRWDVGAVLNGEELPDVRVTFAGPLTNFGRLEPRIDADDLEQFLTVARVERNVERLEELRRQRDTDGPPVEESAPGQDLSAASPAETDARAPDDTSLGDIPLETLDPLPGFSTEIEETPAPPDTPDAGEAQTAETPSEPAPDSTTPGASLDDPQVVEDARREIMREPPRRPQPEQDRFFEIFSN